MVPSVAVREGVLKTLQVTEKHLREQYGNLPYRYYVYDSENLWQLRSFAQSDNVELMVMTIDSFNKASNVIRQTTDRSDEALLYLVRETKDKSFWNNPRSNEAREVRYGERHFKDALCVDYRVVTEARELP